MSGRLYLDVEAGETVLIGGSRVTLQKKSGTRARLLIESGDEVTLDRGVQAESPKAQDSTPTPALPETIGPRPLLSRPALA